MKIKALFLFCFLCHVGFAQQIKCTGTLLTETTQEPIFGAAILLGENSLCFSDPNGKFSFTIEKGQMADSIRIFHMSYESKDISLLEFDKNVTIIELSPKYNGLPAVVISGKKLTTKDIIKKASRKFRDIYREAPYWSSINYKQLIYLNGKPHAYLEFDGHIFMVGQDRDPFVYQLIVPKQIRRTKESPEIIRWWYGKDATEFYLQMGGRFALHQWIKYRFFEVAHPLGKKNGRFGFKMEKQELLNGKACYVVRYEQKRKINPQGRWLDFMHGELWIAKKDFVLQKVTTGFRYENISYQAYTVYYSKLKNKLYPTKIELSQYRFEPSDTEAPNVVVGAVAVLDEINFAKRENYAREFLMSTWHGASNQYDSFYWKNKSLKNINYRNALLQIGEKENWDNIFIKGAQTKEITKKYFRKVLKPLKKYSTELLKRMERDLKL